MQHVTIAKPIPERSRRRAVLVSEGTEVPTYTEHVWHDSVLEPDPSHGWAWPQWALMYKCVKTGALRKFGVVDATERSEHNRTNEDRGLS